MASSAGNGAKGVATGCTEVAGNMGEVVGRVRGASVLSRTMVLIPESCSKSVREAKVRI